jgi:hypothetical protein
LAAERGGAERRQESEAVPNREGVASGSATASFFLAYKKKSARISHGFTEDIIVFFNWFMVAYLLFLFF